MYLVTYFGYLTGQDEMSVHGSRIAPMGTHFKLSGISVKTLGQFYIFFWVGANQLFYKPKGRIPFVHQKCCADYFVSFINKIQIEQKL